MSPFKQSCTSSRLQAMRHRQLLQTLKVVTLREPVCGHLYLGEARDKLEQLVMVQSKFKKT